jgi:hypothetical protein
VNRAARRHQEQEERAMRRRGQRRAKRLPRCPLCANEITERDVAKIEVEDQEVKVHKTCGERFEQAKVYQAAQKLAAGGLWLPGMEPDPE